MFCVSNMKIMYAMYVSNRNFCHLIHSNWSSNIIERLYCLFRFNVYVWACVGVRIVWAHVNAADVCACFYIACICYFACVGFSVLRNIILNAMFMSINSELSRGNKCGHSVTSDVYNNFIRTFVQIILETLTNH